MTKKKGIFLWTIITFLLFGVQMHISYALVCSTEAEPKDILGEIFHFDAQDIDANGLIDSSIWDGNKVSEWRDIANGNHATQNNS